MAQTVRADISRTTQIGIETTLGTTVPANRRFPTMQFERAKPEKRGQRPVKPSTYKVGTSVVGGKEDSLWTAKSDGITYDEMVYVTDTCIKYVTPDTVTLSKHRRTVPRIDTQEAVKTFSIEDGQVGNLWAANGGFFSGFSLKSNPDGVDFSADVFARDLTIPSALTAGPTQIDNKPILIERVGIFTAASFAALDTYTVTLGAQASGTFTLSWAGQTTPAQAFNVSAANLQIALRALTYIGGTSVSVTGAAGGPYTVVFVNSVSGTPVMVGTLTGSGALLQNPGNFSVQSTNTVVDNPIECDLDFSKFRQAYFRIRQGERSYPGTVEVLPDLKVNLTCAIDQTAQEISEAVFGLADWRAGTVRALRWQAVTTDVIDLGVPWEFTVDVNLLVGEPFQLGQNQNLSIVQWPCQVAADSLGNWLAIKSVSKVANL